MKLLLVYNPFAGFGKSGKVFAEIKQLIRAKGMDFDLRFTRAAGEATKMVQEADLSLYDGVISSGGDGTLHEVLNGYYKNTGSSKPPIGVIPNGTGNSFAFEIGLDTFDYKKAIDIISKNKIRKVDVGHCQMQDGEFYFHNILGFGMVADINEAAKKYKKLGNHSYSIASLEKILALRTFDLEIILDGKTIKQDNLFVEISNTTHTGSDFIMAPEAKIDDGLLDVTISRKTSRWNVIKIFAQVFKGTHIHHPDVEYIKAKEIIVKTKENKTLTPDGEQYGTTPITVNCLKEKLEFFWS